MENPFFDRPIINSPYEYPSRHWELDGDGQPTQQIVESRRGAEFITPIPKPGNGEGPGDDSSSSSLTKDWVSQPRTSNMRLLRQ